jgi:probable F420-dependent oxidoreductase
MTGSAKTPGLPAGGGACSLGRIGVWTGRSQWPDDLGAAVDAAAEVEELGFSAVWIGGSSGQFEVAGPILKATKTLVVATGIVQIWANLADDVAEAHHQLTAAYPGRFLLGLGVGHAPAVEATGQSYTHPYAKLVSYLDELDAAERPVLPAERVLAALGDKTLRLSAERARGAHPYNVSPEHTERARAALGPDALLAPEHKAFLGTDPSAARALARQSLSPYLRLPNYTNNLRRSGFDDRDLEGGGSDRLIDALVAWGSDEAVATRLREHLDAGADHVAVQVVGAGDGRKPSTPFAWNSPSLPRREWRRLADAVLR